MRGATSQSLCVGTKILLSRNVNTCFLCTPLSMLRSGGLVPLVRNLDTRLGEWPAFCCRRFALGKGTWNSPSGKLDGSNVDVDATEKLEILY